MENKARIYKTTIYFTDVNDDVGNIEDLIHLVERKFENSDLMINIDSVKSSKDFEWHDDIDINKDEVKSKDLDKYF